MASEIWIRNDKCHLKFGVKKVDITDWWKCLQISLLPRFAYFCHCSGRYKSHMCHFQNRLFFIFFFVFDTRSCKKLCTKFSKGHSGKSLPSWVLSWYDEMTWAVSSATLRSKMRKICTFRSFWACAKYHPGLCSPLIHSTVSINFISRRGRLWSDCAEAQADLGLRCPHMP